MIKVYDNHYIIKQQHTDTKFHIFLLSSYTIILPRCAHLLFRTVTPFLIFS